MIGYEHTFTHQARDLLAAIADDHDPFPSFAEGLQVQQVIDSVEVSAADSSRLTRVHPGPANDGDDEAFEPPHGGP